MKISKNGRINKLVSLCHFYKGDSVAPYYLSPIDKICWQYEKEWAESLAESYTNRDKYVAYFKKISMINHWTSTSKLICPNLFFVISF